MAISDTAGLAAGGIFDRAERLVGGDGMSALAATRVVLFGVGGVGGWCAEALVRSGIGHLTLVDFDRISPSNINRQVMATTRTVGLRKVEVLGDRLRDINPAADIRTVAAAYTEATAERYVLDDYDYVIDAIDNLADKALLICRAAASRATLLSSMGAARKMDPLQIAVAEFWKVHGCPLARALRSRFRRDGLRPARPFRCVYSPEVCPNRGAARSSTDTVNGSLVHATATFGFVLAGLVIQEATLSV